MIFKFLLVSSLSMGCGVFSKPEPKPVRTVKRGESLLRDAQAIYDKGYFEKTVQKIQSFERKYDGSVLEPEFQFLKAKAYFRLGDLKKAEKLFRGTYLSWSGSAIGRSKSLYYLSMVYERLDQDNKVIASLIELKSLQPVLKKRIYLLDIPAKLASAFAREGNSKQAKRYMQDVDQYLKQNASRSEMDKAELELIAKSLYDISSNSLMENKERDFEEQIASIDSNQFYLLRAMELGVSPWSEKSLYLFESIYRQALDLVVSGWTELYARVNQISARRDQQRKLRQLERLGSVLSDLQLRMLPKGVVETEAYRRFLLAIQSYKKEIEIYYLEPEVGQGLTNAALKLQGLDPKYRDLKPDQVLKKYHKQIELPIKDPNL